jgi:2-succinyl-5-enolpyruvyl-6-hydroxy-3-cyclohexene-1-carboxylate synthase
VSKVLRGWLEKCAPEVWMVTARAQNLDGLHLATRAVHGGAGAFARSVVPVGRAGAAYGDAWRSAEQAAVRSLDQALSRAPRNFEGTAAALLGRHLPRLTPVIVANSMPVRDVEYFWPGANGAQPMFCNRGANGIDGTLATALGVAHGNRPAVLLTGDLALLHDANGFLLRPKFRGSLTIVLINNDGGGIFEHLAIAGFNPPFEEFFATPQTVDFRRLCAAHGVGYQRVRDWSHFTRLIARLPRQGIRVLEVRTDRKRDAALRKRIFAEAARAAERAL